MLFRPQLVSISFVCVVYHLMPDHVEVQASITKCYYRCTKTCNFDRCQVSNRPFARPGYMVRYKLCWDANIAVGFQNKELLPVQPDFPVF